MHYGWTAATRGSLSRAGRSPITAISNKKALDMGGREKKIAMAGYKKKDALRKFVHFCMKGQHSEQREKSRQGGSKGLQRGGTDMGWGNVTIQKKKKVKES